jgi:hypothetical protein
MRRYRRKPHNLFYFWIVDAVHALLTSLATHRRALLLAPAGLPAAQEAGLPVCCEQALKSAGERNTHGGGWVLVRGPSGNRPRERSDTSGWREEALLDIEGGDLAALALAAGVIPCWRIADRKCRSLREWQPLKALRAPCGPTPRYKMLYYFTRDTRHETRARVGTGYYEVRSALLIADCGTWHSRARARGTWYLVHAAARN